MFWLIGGADLVVAIVRCLNPAWGDTVALETLHARWTAFAAWDMIGPLFLFVVGVAMPFALGKRVDQDQPLSATYWRIARRFAVLWVLGIIAQGSALRYHIEGLELYSNTLQAIAVGYVVTSLALLHLRVRGQLILFAALLLGYWALLALVPFAGHAAGTLERNANFALYVDELVLGSFRRDHHFTWVITSLGFAATVLLGALAGQLLRTRRPAAAKLRMLVAIGAACLAVGWLWELVLPINRHIWTSSLVVWTGGWCFLLLALFYGVIDVAGIKRWAFPLVVIGANALLAYVFSEVYGRTVSNVLVINLARQLPAVYGELVLAIAEVGILWLGLWYLYRNRTFLRA